MLQLREIESPAIALALICGPAVISIYRRMQAMKSKTLLFCTSYFENALQWTSRYERWLEHHLAIHWSIDSVAMIDDGSPFVPHSKLLEPLDATLLGKAPLPQRALVRFKDNLGRKSTLQYPGWWRSFQLALDLAQSYGFTKLVHVESDTYLLSERMLDLVESTESGWTLFWSSHFKWPETALQIICQDAFAEYASIVKKGPYGLGDLPAEDVLPYTRVVKNLIGDRYSDFNAPIPAQADYAVQVTSAMATSVPGSWMRRVKFKSLSQAAGHSVPISGRVAQEAKDDGGGSANLEDPATILQRGITAYQRGDFSSAIADLQLLVRSSPLDANAHKFLAAAFMQTKRVDDAIQSGEQAASIAPQDAGLANMLGAFYASRDDAPSAFAHWSRALQLDPSDTTALENIRSLESRLGMAPTLSNTQQQLMIERLLGQIVAGEFSRRGLNSLVHLWNPESIDPEKVNRVIAAALKEISMFSEEEARALARAAYAIGDRARALMFIKPLTAGPNAKVVDLDFLSSITPN